MYLDLETSLKTALRGAMRGAEMFGTLDVVDLASTDAPPVSVRVVWRGLSPGSRKSNVLIGDHQFSVEATLVGLRAKDDQQKAFAAGVLEIHKRLIAWRPLPQTPDLYASIDSGQLQDSGGVFQYQINLTVPDVVIRPDQ